MNLPDKQSITKAHERIRSYIHHTPEMTSASIDEMAGCFIFFKCENFQKVGAFKARGAMNAILKLTPELRSKGVATHSSGNHAQALARAAKILGVGGYSFGHKFRSEFQNRVHSTPGFEGSNLLKILALEED